jgi:hypothetical protein
MITLTREEAQQVMDALEAHADIGIRANKAIKTLRAKLSEPEPEPVAVWELQEGGWDTIADRDWMESLPIGTKLYTGPPQREWVGLTDDEVKEIIWNLPYEPSQEHICAIEAKLKEKNA